jgi:alkaline phosphatase D
MNNEQEESDSKHRIAFGSCNDQDVQNNLWPVIESRKPAAFIWGGDAIYADFHTATDWSTFPPTSELQCATPDRLKALYRKQLSVPGYRRLLDQNITVFGTFDGTYLQESFCEPGKGI